MNIRELLTLYAIAPTDVKIHMAIGGKIKNEPWVQLTNNNFKNGKKAKPKKTSKENTFYLLFI